ncbi:MAG: metallophosphoesterase [Novosphingobium sp.]|nr:metallophosphoesterase [Novosphingobium sp.]
MFKRILIAAALVASVPALADSTDRKFTIAAIPDTQNYMDYTHQKAEKFPFDAQAMFFEQMEYIAANLKSAGGEIAFVTGLGDVWQHQTLTIDPAHYMRGFRVADKDVFGKMFAPSPKVLEVEMPAAKKGYELLMGKVPFSVVPGNHDFDAMWTDSKFPAADKVDPKDLSTIGTLHSGGLSNFRAVFGEHTPFFKGKDWYVAANDGGADSAQIFEAGGYRFLHIGLQFDPPDTSLEWAAKVIEKYKGLPTIVSTHDYMNQAGERVPNPLIDGHKVDPQDNSPQMIWDKFLSQHDQIFMLLCGHEHGQSVRTDKNAFGHDVYQVLADYQDRGQTAKDAGVKSEYPVGIGDGWMRLMEFDFEAREPVVRVKTYSTYYKKLSSKTKDYAKWYRDHEQPGMTDKQFHAADEFVIPLTDFVKRFGTGTVRLTIKRPGS